MKNFKNLSRTGIIAIAVMIAAALYFSVNGFNLNSNKIIVHNDQKYSEVRIFAKNDADMKRMADAGLIIDHANRKPGEFMDAWLSAQELNILQNSGVPYQILVDDWDTYYSAQPLMTQMEIDRQMQEVKEKDNITHSLYGSMGGYLTYSEVVAKLDSLRTEYPQFVSAKFSIGNTYENRSIWAVRITKNPDAPTGRPEVMYHSLIHCREPESMEHILYYVYWLVENYNIDPLATFILNNREIYWIPVFNADGYVYNQTTNPNGGGMWRKNRKPCSGGTGADLNRNYGIYQFWNAPNGGSSSSCGSDTYRGSLPFSEPETQALMNFVNSRNFRAGFGAHTHGNYIIKPWAWCDPTPTPDDAMFNVFLADMKASNPIYTIGTPHQTVGYYVRGCADDWYYNDSGHTKSFVMTPETGQSFWPAQNLIIPLAQGMLFNDQYVSLIAGPWVNYVSSNFNQTTYTPGSSGTWKVRFRNKGVMAANNTKIILTPANSSVTIPTQQYNYNLGVFQQDSATFNFNISAGAQNNCYIPAYLQIKIDTSTIYTQGVYIPVGVPTSTVVLNDNAENGIGNWTTEGAWSLHTDSYHSASHSFAYAPYTNDINYSMTLTAPINVQTSPVCNLSFWTRYNLETNYDFGFVEVSKDNGNNWQILTVINGNNLTWTQKSFDITTSANATSQLKVRFRLSSDGNTLGTGWWVDDVSITTYCTGTIVGAPGVTNIPKTFAVAQNYPNPFNPVTVIKYQIPHPEFVSIKVFDVLGKEVVSLVNEKKEPGYYEASFDGSNMASGLYFYRIEAGNFVETKKMMLIK